MINLLILIDQPHKSKLNIIKVDFSFMEKVLQKIELIEKITILIKKLNLFKNLHLGE